MSLSPAPLVRRASVLVRRQTPVAFGYLLPLLVAAAGFAGVILAFDGWGEVRLLGGFAPGWTVGVGLAAAAAVFVLRHSRLPAAARRRRGGGRASRAAGAALFVLRGLIVGGLLGVLTVRSFHPVRATHVYAVVHVADPVNDAEYAAELADCCRQIAADHSSATVEYGTPELGRLVRQLAAGGLKPDDPRVWVELKRQPPAAERLADLRNRLADRVGEVVYVVAVERPSARVQPWPVCPDRHRSVWLSVDPSASPRADRTQLVSYRFMQDAAAAAYLYATVAVKPGEAVPAMVVDATGGPPARAEASGRFGDHYAFRVLVPRDREVTGVRFEGPGVKLDALTGVALARRQLRVKVGPGLDRIMRLPTFADQTAGPIRFVSIGPCDVEWVLGPAPAGGGRCVELLAAAVGYDQASTAWRIARTPAGVASPLGSVTPPKAGSEFRNFSAGLALDPADRRLIDLAREPDPPAPLVFTRAAAANRVTVVVPRAEDVSKLEGNVPQALGKLVVWASSLAARDGNDTPAPVREWQLDPTPGDDAMADTGRTDSHRPLPAQLIDALAGRLDANTHLAAGNSVRAACDTAAWAGVALLLLLTATAGVVNRLTRPVA